MEVNLDKLRKQVEKASIAKAKCVYNINHSTGEKYLLYREKFKILNEKYWLLQEKLDYYESNYIIGDNELEIKRFGNSLENMYSIYLRNQGIKVGYIDYRGYHFSSLVGDIGYVIDMQYQGHNYAAKALELLSYYLYENSIPDFYISVFTDNTPSLKIILRTIFAHGGDIVENNGKIITFKCMTKKIDDNKKRV